MLKSRSYSTALKLCLRNFASKPSDIVIAAAVRTPIVSSQHTAVELLIPQLNKLATEAVIKQATLPKEDIDDVHLVKPTAIDTPPSGVQSDLLKRNVTCTIYNNDLEALRSAIDKLQHGKSKSVIITAADSLPNFGFNDAPIERFKSAALSGLYDAEITPITFRQKERQIVTVTQDEPKLLVEETAPIIATALALTTSANAACLNIEPKARLLNSTHSSGHDHTILTKQLLSPMGLNVQDVHHWELQSKSDGINLASNLDLSPNFIHTNSIPGIFGQSIHNAVTLQLTHLVHILKSKQLGCTLVTQTDGSTDGFLLENQIEVSDHLPLLTLYTKDPCPLCDILIEELEFNFSNGYQLEKVFIDRKENVRYLRLYRYDIPVLFVNGQFLCMHRLNSKLLRRKLDEIKRIKE